MVFKNPRLEWKGKLEDYPLENYPDYVSGGPPNNEALKNIGFLDEVERIWGKQWGGDQGIGRLREVALVKPTEHEMNPLWAKAPELFLLRRGPIDEKCFEALVQNHERLAEILEENGVKIYWREINDTMGAYGPIRKLFVGKAAITLKGGAIVPRHGQASFLRGVARNLTEFFAKIGCPILLTISGHGTLEAGAFVPLAEDVLLGTLSPSVNQEAIEQFMPVFKAAGGKEIHFAHAVTMAKTYTEPVNFLHVDAIVSPVDVGLVVAYPPELDYQTYLWLKEKGFEIIEVPPDEYRKYQAANLIILEPGKVIMPTGAQETVARVRKAGVDVIELDTEGLIKGGVNGIECLAMYLLRDPGPALEEIKR
jgi:N-dimethylarginine dimethylaminohydrolase